MSEAKLKCIFFIFLLVVLSLFFIEVSNKVFIGIALVLCLLFLFRKESNKMIEGVYCRPVHIFLLSYLIVFFQTPIDYLLGNVNSYKSLCSVSLVPTCLLYAVIGLICFFLGYLNYQEKEQQNKQLEFIASPTVFKALTSLFIVLILLTTPLSILRGGYREMMDETSLFNYLNSWTNLFIISFFIQHSLSLRKSGMVQMTILDFVKSVGYWQNINLLAISIIILNIGDRGPLIIWLTAYFVAFVFTTKNCPSKKLMLLAICCAAFVFSFLGRTKSFRDDNTIFDRIEAVQDMEVVSNSVSPQTAELAGSYKCLAFSIFNVPSREDYKYGQYQLGYVLSIIPMSSRVVKTVGTSSSRVTRFVQGDNPTYGNGTSVLADFYLDGGLLAIIIGMFLVGLFFRKIEYVLFIRENPSFSVLCISFYFSAHAMYIPRSFILLYAKYAVWMILIMVIINKIPFFRERV